MLVTAKLQFDATRKKHIASPCGLSLPFLFLVRLRDHGAWPGISQYSISHVAFFISHFYLACRIFISHFYLTSRIFISHLAFFLSRISHFYLAFNSRNFFLLLLSRISNVPYRLPYLQASVLPYISYYPTAARRVQITPKTSTNITRYLHSRGPVRQVCLLLTKIS